MNGPLLEVAAVFFFGLVLQLVVSRHRVAVAIATTIIAFAMMVVTVGWDMWERDALWIVGFTVAFVEYAAASLASGFVALGINRLLESN